MVAALIILYGSMGRHNKLYLYTPACGTKATVIVHYPTPIMQWYSSVKVCTKASWERERAVILTVKREKVNLLGSI